MATTLGDIKQLINDRRRDSTSNSVDMGTDGFRAINGALQIWDTEHDWTWQEESFKVNYNPGIDTYALDSELSFKSIIDVRGGDSQTKSMEFYYISNNKFDSEKIKQNIFAIDTDQQRKYLRLKMNHGFKLSLASAVKVDGDEGVWQASGAVQNLTDNPFESYSGLGSLKFDINGTLGALELTGGRSLCVARYQERSSIFVDVFLQEVDLLSSITLKVGSDASNYITGAVSTDYLNRKFQVGWNRIRLNWTGTTTVVGTPDVDHFGYISVQFDYVSNPSSKGNRLENVFISENVPVVVDYYSHFMAVDASEKKTAVFANPAEDDDLALWSGEWDFVNEAFVNSVLEIIFWMTGETQDRDIAIERIRSFVIPLRDKLPSRKRFRQVSLISEVNF